MTFGRTLQELTRLCGVKRCNLADALGYDPSYISRWINGVKHPSLRSNDALPAQIAAYLTANRPYKPYTDGRITEVATGVVPEATTDTATADEAKPATGEAATDTGAKSAESGATTGDAAATSTATGMEAATGASSTAATAGGKHVIARGDTLWDLAKAAYGNGALWRKIAEANGNPRPRALHVGTELSIPAK